MADVVRLLASAPEELAHDARSGPVRGLSLRPGPFRYEKSTIDLGDISLELTVLSGPITVLAESFPDRAGVFLLLHGTETNLFCGQPVHPGTMYLFGPEAEYAGLHAGPARYVEVTFAPNALDQRAERLGADLNVPERSGYRVAPAPEWADIRVLLEDVVALAQDSDRIEAPTEQRLRSELLEISTRALSGNEAPVTGGRDSVKVARACIDYAQSQRYQGITLADLSAASGASERQVRGAFNHALGVSPRAYLRIAALHEVRRTLREQPDLPAAVSRAATDAGFWHLGRFASQYRALFGESPGTTVARERSSHPQRVRTSQARRP